jgi:cytoskeletal protein RodZ
MPQQTLCSTEFNVKCTRSQVAPFNESAGRGRNLFQQGAMTGTNGNSIGSILRSERLRQGKALDLVAEETKICPAILEAIENDQFDALPGGAYRRSFLRQYASAVGLDEEEAVAAFRRQYKDIPVDLPSVPKPQTLRHLRGPGLALLAGLAVAGFYTVAKDGSRQYNYRATGPPPRPARKPSVPAIQNVTESKPTAPVRAVFSTTEPVWVSVSCDGKPTYTGTLSQTESRSFEASVSVTVLVGNAGGLTITLNGQPVGPIGARGEIQLLELTPKGTRRLPRAQSTRSAKQRTPEA